MLEFWFSREQSDRSRCLPKSRIFVVWTHCVRPLNFGFEKRFGSGFCWELSWLDNLLKFQFLANRAIVRVACLNLKIFVVFAKSIPEFCIRKKIFIGNVGTGGILCWLDSLVKFQFSANRAIVRVACLNPEIWWFLRNRYLSDWTYL